MITKLNNRLIKLHAALAVLDKQFNGFTSGDYEVRFLQDARLTVCVIRNLHKLDERYTGVSVLHPHDKFSAATGRHKAFKKVLENVTSEVNHPWHWNGDHFMAPCNLTISFVSRLPVSQLHADYWKRYEAEEK
jgi:hypothetical protein